MWYTRLHIREAPTLLARRTALVALALVFAPALTGCLEPIASGALVESALGALPDPTLPGALEVLRREYDFGVTLLNYGDAAPFDSAPFPASMRGSVHYPAKGDGPFPLVLFMHGRHGTCALLDREFLGTSACPDVEPVVTPVDSYAGYDYVAEPLASHGYVVVSVDANGVNDRDSTGDYGTLARAQLVVRTLDRFAALATKPGEEPIGDDLVGRVDLSRVGLMGHSRGGEGVTRAITLNAERTDGMPHAIRAVFSLAPTDFNDVVAPDVAYATLLPYCDGDVSNLWGAHIYDDSRYLDEAAPAPKYQIVALGANHNFYNTVWYQDDAGYRASFREDPHCGPVDEARDAGRLSPEDQRRHGLAYLSAFFRHHLGGEEAFAALFTAAAPPPPSACAVGFDACASAVLVTRHAPPAERLLIEDGEGAGARNDLGGAVRVAGPVRVTRCEPRDCPATPNVQRAAQVTLAWDGLASWAHEIPAAHGDVARFDALTFRVAVNYDPDSSKAPAVPVVSVVLRDAAGRSASVDVADHSAALFAPPGEGARKVTLNMARVPLAAFAGVDLSAVRAVELALDGASATGIQVADLMFQAETPWAATAPMPSA